MAVIKRGEVPAPTLAKQTVDMPTLGGDVVVRGLLLTERLALVAGMAHTPADDDATPASRTALYAVMPTLLAQAVVDADGLPLWTADEWQVFGSAHEAKAIELFNTAWRLSGFAQAEQAKN